MKQLIQRFWRDETGQSTTEYILILAVIVMITMKFKTTIQGTLEKLMGRVGADLDSAASSNAQ
ncbi:MAG: Flp family type IVb pilin [Bdellovibrionia bacterium]